MLGTRLDEEPQSQLPEPAASLGTAGSTERAWGGEGRACCARLPHLDEGERKPCEVLGNNPTYGACSNLVLQCYYQSFSALWLCPLGKPLTKPRAHRKPCRSTWKNAIWGVRSCKRCNVLFYFDYSFASRLLCHDTHMGAALWWTQVL